MSDLDLAAVHVVVLRVDGADDEVADALRCRGAIVAAATVATVRDVDDEVLLGDVGDLGRFAFVAVTSRHAARRLALWAHAWPSSVRIGVVGPASLREVQLLGLTVDIVAAHGTAASLGDDIAAATDVGPVLFLAAASARDDLRAALAMHRIDVEVVTAYRIEPRALDAADLAAIAGADAVLALSPHSVDAVASPGVRASVAHLVAIGPTTAAHAGALGIPVAAVAATREPSALADAVAAAVAGPSSGTTAK